MIKELSALTERLYNNKYKEVYIWGTGAVGRDFYRYYLDNEINITGFIDSAAEKTGGKIDGLPVYLPDILMKSEKNSVFIFLAILPDKSYFEVKHLLWRSGFVEGVHFCNIAGFRMPSVWRKNIAAIKARKIFDNTIEKKLNEYSIIYDACKNLAITEGRYEQLEYIFNTDLLNSEFRDVFFPAFDLPITLKCTLKCLDCSACVPYINNPEHFKNVDRIVSDISKITSAAYIFKMNILGGEPFLHTGLEEILRRLLLIKNIGLFEILTNGTVTPDDNILRLLSENPRITIRISRYSVSYDKVSSLVDLLKKENISHYVTGDENTSWYKLGGFHSRNYDRKTLEHLYLICNSTVCNSYINGRLFACPRLSISNYIGAIPDNSQDYIDIKNTPVEDLKIKLADYFNNTNFYPGCNFCNGAYDEGLKTAAAEQADDRPALRSFNLNNLL